MFVSQFNIVTGQKEWELLDEDYDYKQEIARSDYGDMLHDTDRNKKYYAAIKEVISSMQKSGKEVRVLDIGTGSGLLSMMAAKCGADYVTACEAFLPIAKCATKVIARNGFSDRIHVIGKRSTDLVVGVDLPKRANLLVAEVFDTELIGEGAIETFRHAAANLLTEDAVVIPNSARLYAIPIHSEHFFRHNRLSPEVLTLKDDCELRADMRRCPGTVSLHDIQASVLSQDKFPGLITPLTNIPVMVKHFFFFPETAILKHDRTEVNCKITADGEVHAFIVWWDLLMNPSGDNVISMAPDWISEQSSPWRDHWMQAIYYPLSSEPRKVSINDSLGIRFRHDEYSLVFDTSDSDKNDDLLEEMPLCGCGIHYNFSRQRIARLSTPNYKAFCTKLASSVFTDFKGNWSDNRRPIIVCLSDSSGIPIACLKNDSSGMVISVEINEASKRFVHRWRDNISESLAKRWIISSSIDEAVKACHIAMDTANADIYILGEPYFLHSTLPWHGITFLFQAQKLKSSFTDVSVKVLPSGLDIYLAPLNFTNLHKLRVPVKNFEDFDLRDFDDIIDTAVSETDGKGCGDSGSKLCERPGSDFQSSIESHSLWEYRSIALSNPQHVLNMKLDDCTSLQNNHGVLKNDLVSVSIERCGAVNGIAVWSEWNFGGTELNRVAPNGGLIDMDVDIDKNLVPVWDNLNRQGVYFLHDPISVRDEEKMMIKWKWSSDLGDLKLCFTDVSM